MSTATAIATRDPWQAYAERTDRWDAVRAVVVIAFAMLTWTVVWAGGPAAVATIAIGALALVAVDVHTRRVRADVPESA